MADTQTSKKVNKTFKLTDDEISLIKCETDKMRSTDFQKHGYRINHQISYDVGFLKNGYMEKYININLTDEDGEVTTLVGYIGESLEAEEKKTIKASIDQDLSDATAVEYVINK